MSLSVIVVNYYGCSVWTYSTNTVYSLFWNLDSVLASGPNRSITGVGLDTLEEQEEKEIFFAKLEQEASSTIDYSRLNKELDSNDSVILAPSVR